MHFLEVTSDTRASRSNTPVRSSPAQTKSGTRMSITRAADTEQAEQTGEQVEHRHIQADGCQYVVVLAAVHDAAGLKQNQTGG